MPSTGTFRRAGSRPLSVVPWALIAVSVFTVSVFADAPLKPPATYTVSSLNGKYHAEVHLANQRTTVYEGSATQRRATWSIPGWHRVVAIANDGRSLVLGYDGVNLLPRNFTGDEVLLTFYHQGKLVGKVTVRALLPDRTKLRKTASHWSWGNYLGFRNNLYQIQLVSGALISFDPVTGQRVP